MRAEEIHLQSKLVSLRAEVEMIPNYLPKYIWHKCADKGWAMMEESGLNQSAISRLQPI